MKRAISIILILLILVSITAFAAYRQGDRGEKVKQIQTRLKRWGYYSGNIDGIYGKKTTEAVKYFQRTNGLTVDGICGKETFAALGLSEGSNQSGSNDFYLLARMIAAEARGEPYVGQVAVGAVILNRVEHPSFPNSISGVIYQPGAFSAIGDGQWAKTPVTDSARKAAQDALNGWDPTGGAIYYYNPAKTTSTWIYSRPVVTTIGAHVFAK
ncbi:MAG: spore cortex-lytic enzyme [Clostridia bacterium]|nr:spore cortex-lytic enzyme [Clostridia bacterium]